MLVVFFYWFAAFCLTLTGLIGYLIPAKRRAAESVLLFTATFWTLLVLGMVSKQPGALIFDWVMQGVAKRGDTIVAAIRAYDEEHHSPPSRLEDLVPKHLASIPETGLGYSPAFEYATPLNPGPRWRKVPGAEHWIISVRVAGGSLNRNELRYYPSGTYPDVTSHGRVIRIAKWAYFPL